MNIVLWADLQCPFCLVGEENLKNAIQELGLEDQINMDIKSYEIHRPEDGEGDHSLIQIFQEKMDLPMTKRWLRLPGSIRWLKKKQIWTLILQSQRIH